MEENFIRANIDALLSLPIVKAKMGEIAGEWTLLEIDYIHSMPRNIEFGAIFQNDSNCVKVMAKINRQSAKFSNVEIWDL